MATFLTAMVATLWETTLWTATQPVNAVAYFIHVTRHIGFKKMLGLSAPPAPNVIEYIYLFNTSHFDPSVLAPMCPKVTTTDIILWTGPSPDDPTLINDIFVKLYWLLKLTAHLWLPYIIFALATASTVCVVSLIINTTKLRSRYTTDAAKVAVKISCLKMIIRIMGKGEKKSLRAALKEAYSKSFSTGRRLRKLSKIWSIQEEAYQASIQSLSKRLQDASSTSARQDITIARLNATIEKLEADKLLNDSSISELKDLVAKKDNDLNTLIVELESKDAQILGLEDQIVHGLAKFSSDDTTISELNAVIEQLYIAGYGKDSSIVELQGAAQQKDQLISKLESSLAEIETILGTVPPAQNLSLSPKTHVAISPVRAVQKLSLTTTCTSFEILPYTPSLECANRIDQNGMLTPPSSPAMTSAQFIQSNASSEAEVLETSSMSSCVSSPYLGTEASSQKVRAHLTRHACISP